MNSDPTHIDAAIYLQQPELSSILALQYFYYPSDAYIARINDHNLPFHALTHKRTQE
ncbi:hypothetical protein HanRHA438_Chr15g0717521 [Helianthus annuus]|nr:hypothetical protein HanRHA438_Chr15g0717521 [Helianthus annuus]